ncbi:ribonuclease E/G [Pseudaestuariivita rosea]|uniref:ribonuclease E/G n=1 Tax=Pseudaestuariivita rosea TaxID=2763263 RepID=UPI001ABB37CD|nr:ribonuclease E/G [Pseudaestuariivita rosea]
MKGRLIALDHWRGRAAAALMVDGRLEDLLVDSTSQPAPGTIYRSIIDRPIKGQGGVIVRLPDYSGFLRQAKGLSEGQRLLVQVTGFAEPGKAVPVTSKILFKSRYAIVTPNAPGLNISRTIKDDGMRDQLLELAHDTMQGSDFGLILRSSCADAETDEIAGDVQSMRAIADRVMADTSDEAPLCLVEGDSAHTLAWREWTQPAQIETHDGSFEQTGALDQIDELGNPNCRLPGGGHMYVEPTHALVAVDVNTAGDTSPAAGLRANLAAVRDLPRQLRLRGLGGQITIDFAPLPKKDRRQLETALRAAFRADPVETALVGWTPLGHFELQRKRERLPLKDF